VSDPQLARLSQIMQNWEKCRRCALAREGRTQVVFYRGNPRAQLAIIGEAPGGADDTMGLPFVGQNGELLDSLLAEAGLDSNEDCFMLNVVGCRPPRNRQPLPVEMAVCAPRWQSMIWASEARLVITLGGTALTALTGEVGVNRNRGRPHDVLMDWKGGGVWIRVVPTFHPNYLTRNGDDPSIRHAIVSDMTIARGLCR
jgi:DNA polymerase